MRPQKASRRRREREAIIDSDCQPILVPRNDKPLAANPAERTGRLHEHLARIWRAMREQRTAASPLRPAPTGFAAHVIQTACTLCAGWCCRNGADDAFLDEATLARVANERPHLTGEEVLNLYLERIPEVAVERSCIFHGKEGCTLDRALRSDVCNAYFCGGLLAFTRQSEQPTATVIIAGDADRMRTSPILQP
jgi:hypothetical protein